MRHRGRLVSIPRSIPRSTPKICIGTASRNIGDQPKLRSYKEATEYLQQSKKRRLAEIEANRATDALIRRQRRERQKERQKTNWGIQLPSLVDAYLEWKGSSEPLPDFAGGPNYTYNAMSFEFCGVLELSYPDDWLNTGLMRRGYIGNSPMAPNRAIGLKVLESFHKLRGDSPRTSVGAFVKEFCSNHKVAYTQTIRTDFSNAYNAYVRVITAVERKVEDDQGSTGSDCMKHASPAGLNKQPNEPQLAFDTQASTDHNNSLKRTSPSARNAADFQSSYWRESAEVEQVAPPMTKRKSRKSKRKEDSTNVDDDDGDTPNQLV